MGLTLTRKQAIRMLGKIGATFDEGGRHIKVSLVVKGKTLFKTVLSRGSKNIPTGTAKKIFREIGLAGSVEKCIALRDFPLKRDEYIAYLQSKGFL